ncbi:hypothetical protein DSO57_1026128 [Entomophthora muscae]|uniref:Uncharacterized protein n=1 Tax=Entomophthora muscae TaxID=34485 RepID=A0ACC2U007_9FUNG|nr:hypothetical protein DSO57_1026128 [Entomophthora muscae]
MVPELMRHLGSFKEQFEIPFPDYKKSTSFSASESKGKSLEKDPLKKPTHGAVPSTNNPENNCTFYKSGKLGHLSQDFRKFKVNVCHLDHKGSNDNKHTEEEKEGEEDSEEPKKLLSSQVEKKPLTASSNCPSPTIDPDPNIPDQDSCLMDQ